MDPRVHEYCEPYRRAFLAKYPMEEYNFRFVHDFCYINRWRYLHNDYVKEKTADHRRKHYEVVPIRSDDTDQKEKRYCEIGRALRLMRDFIRETIWLSNFPASQAAIAVPDKQAADYLRNGVGFPGVIINLQALNYPGMDGMHPVYLAQFRECGLENHMPYTGSWVKEQWAPTWINRSDSTFGFIKCSFRSVTVMRHWSELWYPVTVAQARILNSNGVFYYEMYSRFWDTFLRLLAKELEKLWPQFKPTITARTWLSA
jgi:hypothetical protein